MPLTIGGWYIKGGMRKLVEAVEKIAKEEGVQFHYNEEAVGYERRVLESKKGKTERADILICNGEVIRTANTLLKNHYSDKEKEKLNAPALSSSGFILLLGVKGENKQLKHHNISFSRDYPGEFKSIFETKELPDDPTIYISITKKEDAEDAPEGGENWFVLVNTPAKSDFSEVEFEKYGEKIIKCLRDRNILASDQSIEVKRAIHAGEMAIRDHSSHGALYGWASHSILSSLFRPAMKHPREEIYFVGGSTHPGGGIPLVLLSSKMIYRKILKNFS
jgi:phytoene desaturase